MFQLRSQDVASGTSTNGAYNLQSAVSGSYSLVHSDIEDSAFYFIHAPINVLHIQKVAGAVDYVVTFTAQKDATPATVAAAIAADFTTAIGADLDTVVHEPANNRYVVTLLANYEFYFSNPLSTFSIASGDVADQLSSMVFYISDANFISDSPLLDVRILESMNRTVTTSSSRAPDFFIPTDNSKIFVQPSIDLAATTSITIQIERPELGGVPVPLDGRFVLTFVQ